MQIMKRMFFLLGLCGLVSLVSCASGMDEIQPKEESGVEADSIPNISGVAEDTVPHAYIPMLIPGNQWTELIVGSNPVHPTTHINIIELGNDTIVEGIKYTQLIEYYNRVLPSLDDTSVYISYIREDITNQQIFHKFDGWPEELLYDFQLHVGDVVGDSYYPYYVDAIDFIDIGGISRKKITLYPTLEEEPYQDFDRLEWIEGIGRLNDGILCGMQMPGAGAWVTLTSFSQNGAVVYPESATGIPQISLSRRK
ncbi:hypothetical protein AGMMS49525_10980 [Bacteroidia bacterium]|nr:hypothetical protein AGMMS49525_10980 [Bacteroidia bacterium]